MDPINLHAWAARWGVNPAALAELRMLCAAPIVPPAPGAQGDHEAVVQSEVRLEAARLGIRLFRNNVGALQDERGIPVRFGLANDNAHINKVLKSSDLIGWRPVTITPDMVGRVLAQFVSRECKARDWTWRGTEREQAQQAWITLVLSEGGDAAFTTGAASL